jgi:hypothetical protein
MTAGLEASHRADDADFAGDPRRAAPLGWPWVAAVGAVLGALVGLVVSQDASPALAVLAGAAAVGTALLGNVIAYRRAAVSVANALIEAASWWLAAILVPLTVIAAIAATALWLVVDDTFSLNDGLASVLVGVVGALALWRLARGLAGGGWGGRGWGVALSPRVVTAALFAGAVGVGVWGGRGYRLHRRRAQQGQLDRRRLRTEGGLAGGGHDRGGRARRAAAPRPRARAVGAAAPVVHGGRDDRDQHPVRGGRGHDPHRRGGRGGVLDRHRRHLGRGRAGRAVPRRANQLGVEQELRERGEAWGPLADAIRRDLEQADDRDAALDAQRAAALALPDEAARDERLAEIAAEQGAIENVRDHAAAAEKEAQASPTWWAQDLYSIVARPLSWIVFLLVLLMIAQAILLGALVARARGGPRGRCCQRCFAAPPDGPGGWPCSASAPRPSPGPGPSGPSCPRTRAGCPSARSPGPPSRPPGCSPSSRSPACCRSTRAGGARTWAAASSGCAGRRPGLRRGHVPAPRPHRRRRRAHPHRPPLPPVLRRLEGDYDEIVIVAHSQGTMLTIATLFGDARRRHPEAGGSLWGVRPWTEAVGASRLTGALRGVVTMGSPFRQTYEARLPGQYDWLDPARPSRGRCGWWTCA